MTTNKRIVITAGHSEVDPGAVNPRLKLTEAKLAVQLRDNVAGILKAKGFDVATDGAKGENQPLPKAIALIKGSALAVEIHFNAGPVLASGVEAISKPALRGFAQALALAVSTVTKAKLRGSGGWIDQTQSQHSRLGFVEAGGVILELEFISNDSAMAVYQANAKAVNEAIAATIAKFAA